jgi:hypothetical protein
MSDSQRQPGMNSSGMNSHRPQRQPPTDSSPAPARQRQSAGQIRQTPRRPARNGTEEAARARPFFPANEQTGKRPVLPHAQETSEAQFERTERLRALRKDFLNHAQTRVEPQRPRNIILAVVLSICMLVLCIVGVVAFLQLKPVLFASPGQNVATSFMDAMQQSNYTSAFANCSNTVEEVTSTHTHPLSKQDFINQAQQAEKAGGAISSYAQTDAAPLDANNIKYTFTITRNHVSIPNVILVVSKGSDGSWKISSIDATLLTAPPPPNATPTNTPPPGPGAWIPAGDRNIA